MREAGFGQSSASSLERCWMAMLGRLECSIIEGKADENGVR